MINWCNREIPKFGVLFVYKDQIVKFFTLWAVWSLLQLQLTLIVHRLRICAFVYLLKCACNPQINTWNASVVITKLTQSIEIWFTWGTHVQLQSNKVIVCLIFPFFCVLWTSVLFLVYLVPSFLHFCVFCWWFCGLKWPSSVGLKC